MRTALSDLTLLLLDAPTIVLTVCIYLTIYYALSEHVKTNRIGATLFQCYSNVLDVRRSEPVLCVF